MFRRIILNSKVFALAAAAPANVFAVKVRAALRSFDLTKKDPKEPTINGF
jgi:hypothetical protein